MGFERKKKQNSQKTNEINIIEFMGMISEKFGAIEKYNLELISQLKDKNINLILVYNEIPSNVDFVNTIANLGAKIEVLSPYCSSYARSVRIIKLIRKYQPSVIHCHFNFPLIRQIIFFCWIFQVPKRFVSIRSMPSSNPMFFSKLWYFGLSLITTRFLTVSDAIRSCLTTNYIIQKRKILTVKRGVDFRLSDNDALDMLKLKQSINIDHKSLIIGSIAFHNPIKGVDLLLEAMNIIVNQKGRNDIVLMQIGFMEGKYHNSLIKYTEDKQLQNNVYWLGLRDDVPNLLKIVDVYCQPSRSEGLGLAIVEAFGSKKPVVAFNVGGISEVVHNNISGYLIEPYDVAKMSDRLVELIDNPLLANRFAQEGYKFVMSNFQLQKQVAKMIDVYLK